tara:strand:+ start:116 stop:568 length:453 start_codon:yes stop_codon:yes gene_type:complete
MNGMEPAERKRLNKEVMDTLGNAPEHAWNMQKFKEEVMPAHQKAHEEFMRKSPAAKRAWTHQKLKEEMTPGKIKQMWTPVNLEDDKEYEHQFRRKEPEMRSIFGENPEAPPFRPMAKQGGKKSKKSKKAKRKNHRKTRAKKSRKKRGTRR